MSQTQVRLLGAATVAVLLPLSVLSALPAASAAPTTGVDAPVASHAAAQAGQAKKCRARLKSPKRKVAGKTFASCVLAAQRKARTAVVRTAYDDGTWAKGPYRFGATTDASVRDQDGGGIVALGKNFWVKQPGERWVKAERNSADPDAQLAYVTGTLWRATASDASYKKLLSSTTWKPTGKVKRIKGVKARQYTGRPTHPSGTVEAYAVWLDDKYRTVRVTSTLSAYGMRVKMTQDYSRWGKKVSITAPKA